MLASLGQPPVLSNPLFLREDRLIGQYVFEFVKPGAVPFRLELLEPSLLVSFGPAGTPPIEYFSLDAVEHEVHGFPPLFEKLMTADITVRTLLFGRFRRVYVDNELLLTSVGVSRWPSRRSHIATGWTKAGFRPAFNARIE